jgi:hypothetical protein
MTCGSAAVSLPAAIALRGCRWGTAACRAAAPHDRGQRGLNTIGTFMHETRPSEPEVSSGASQGAAKAPHRRRAHAWVIAGCTLAVLIFLGAVAILYWEWAVHENPSAVIIFQGDATLDEATVRITPIGAARRVPLEGQVKAGIGHRLRFHVPPGRYDVTVWAEGRAIFQKEFQVEPLAPVYIGPESPPANQAANEP